MPQGNTSRRRLLVEGEDDQHVVSNLLHQHDIENRRLGYREQREVNNGTIAIERKSGAPELLSDLTSELKRPNQECVGVIVDIDSEDEGVPGGVQSRWDSVRNRVLQTGTSQDVPETPRREGTVFTIEQPERDLRFGLWLMPDNAAPGAIEHFLLGIIPEQDTLLDRARACLNTVSDEERLFREVDETKALIHTWLAWQQRPGRPMGGAVYADFFDTGANLAELFVGWIRHLYRL